MCNILDRVFLCKLYEVVHNRCMVVCNSDDYVFLCDYISEYFLRVS